jgi:hypothetical protein
MTTTSRNKALPDDRVRCATGFNPRVSTMSPSDKATAAEGEATVGGANWAFTVPQPNSLAAILIV